MPIEHINHIPLQQTKGFTLLEVMIALLIFSIGMLGLAGLQAGGLKSTKVADLRSIAIIAAQDMAARINANSHGAGNFYHNITAAPSSPTNCTTSVCTTNAQVASWDAYEWEKELASELPSGSGTVTFLANGTYRITVSWNEPGTGNAIKSYVMDFQPS